MESVFGLVGKDFAIVAADSSSVHNILVHKTNEDKIMVLDSHKLMGTSGESGDQCRIHVMGLTCTSCSTNVEFILQVVNDVQMTRVAIAQKRSKFIMIRFFFPTSGYWKQHQNLDFMLSLAQEIYLVQKKIPKQSSRWINLQILSGACLIISIAADVDLFTGVVYDLKVYKPFKTVS